MTPTPITPATGLAVKSATFARSTDLHTGEDCYAIAFAGVTENLGLAKPFAADGDQAIVVLPTLPWTVRFLRDLADKVEAAVEAADPDTRAALDALRAEVEAAPVVLLPGQQVCRYCGSVIVPDARRNYVTAGDRSPEAWICLSSPVEWSDGTKRHVPVTPTAADLEAIVNGPSS